MSPSVIYVKNSDLKFKFRERKLQETDIADDLPALLAHDERDVLVVELVSCCLRRVPVQFVKFLKTT